MNTHSQQSPLHPLPLLPIYVHPPLRSPLLGIRAKNPLIPMTYPSTNSNNRALRQKLPTNRRPSLGHHSFERQALGRVQTARLLDDGIEEGQIPGLSPRDGEGERGGVEFGEEAMQRGGMAEEEVNDGAEENGGGVRAGEDVGCRPDGERSMCRQLAHRTRVFAREGKREGTRVRPYESGRLASLSLASMKRDRKSRPLRSSSSMPMSAAFSGVILRRSWARALAKAMMGEVARGRRGPRMGFLYQR